MKYPIITFERLHELLNYNPDTGVFTWRVRTSNRISVGDRAGRDNGNGYRRINIDGQGYYEHQLAWLYIHHEWPENEVDHKDGIGMNNKISNLRHGTHAENSQNLSLRSTNKSGAIGVSWAKNIQKWEAYIWVNYKKKCLGYFNDIQQAREAYLNAKQELHAFQPTPRGAV